MARQLADGPRAGLRLHEAQPARRRDRAARAPCSTWRQPGQARTGATEDHKEAARAFVEKRAAGVPGPLNPAAPGAHLQAAVVQPGQPMPDSGTIASAVPTARASWPGVRLRSRRPLHHVIPALPDGDVQADPHEAVIQLDRPAFAPGHTPATPRASGSANVTEGLPAPLIVTAMLDPASQARFRPSARALFSIIHQRPGRTCHTLPPSPRRRTGTRWKRCSQRRAAPGRPARSP